MLKQPVRTDSDQCLAYTKSLCPDCWLVTRNCVNERLKASASISSVEAFKTFKGRFQHHHPRLFKNHDGEMRNILHAFGIPSFLRPSRHGVRYLRHCQSPERPAIQQCVSHDLDCDLDRSIIYDNVVDK